MRRTVDHPILYPLWRRAALMVVCVLWAIVEFATNEPFWGVIALGFAGYAYWIYIHTYPGTPEDVSPTDKR